MNEQVSKSVEERDRALKTSWQREPDVLTRHSGNAILMAIPGCDDVRKVEGSAAVIWSALARPASEAQLIGLIAANCDRNAEAGATELHRACTELAHIGAIRRVR